MIKSNSLNPSLADRWSCSLKLWISGVTTTNCCHLIKVMYGSDWTLHAGEEINSLSQLSAVFLSLQPTCQRLISSEFPLTLRTSVGEREKEYETVTQADQWLHISPHLVTKGVAFIPFHTSRDAHPQTPQPQTDGTAKTEPTLHVSLAGLQERQTERE